jgi:hypothetical protein
VVVGKTRNYNFDLIRCCICSSKGALHRTIQDVVDPSESGFSSGLRQPARPHRAGHREKAHIVGKPKRG